MKINSLWSSLAPRQVTLDTLKKDLSEGKVPELPYFIVGQKEAKDAISIKISEIDGRRMQTNLIIAPYGNGKTNLLKYLKLYFETHNPNISVLYSRADVEQPDLILFLLKLIQHHFTPILLESIIFLRSNNSTIPNLANGFEDNFSAIQEYTNKIFSKDLEPEDIKNLYT